MSKHCNTMPKHVLSNQCYNNSVHKKIVSNYCYSIDTSLHLPTGQCSYNKLFMLHSDKNDKHSCSIFNGNKVRVLVAGFQAIAMIDSGASLSVISSNFTKEIGINKLIKRNTRKNRNCILADGSTIVLNKTITIPLKIKQVTINAELYVLPMQHVTIIIGCDLLSIMNAKIDFTSKELQFQAPGNPDSISCLHLSSLGQLKLKSPSEDSVPNAFKKLDKRVQNINLNDSKADDTEKQELINLLNEYADIFASDLKNVGRTDIIEYDIEIPHDAKPIRIQQYKYPYQQRDIINEEVQKLLDADQAEIAKDNKWQFPCLLVSKPRSDQKRLYIDFRRLNDITPLHPQSPFDMDHFLCDLGKQNSKFFSVLDLKSAFNQIPLSKRSQEICTFSCPLGSIRLKTCPFGLKNLPAIFSKLMDVIFLDIKNKFMVFYLDDIIIFSNNFVDHMKHLREVFRRLRTASLTIEPSKTHLFKSSVTFLGINISAEGITTEATNIEKVKNYPIPKTQKQVRGFVSLCSFYRKHIKNFAQLASPLYELTKKYKGKFRMTPEAIDSFNVLKHKLTTAPLLTYAKMGEHDPPLKLVVDSSKLGVGFILSQSTFSPEIDKYIDKPIFYGSKNFDSSQQKLGSTELEALGLTIAVKKIDSYLRGRHFILITDHKALTYILNKRMDELKPSLARKVMFLSQYDFKLVHQAASKVSNADALSREVFNENKSEKFDQSDLFAVIHKDKATKPVLDFTDLEIDKLNEKSIREGQKRDYFYRSMYNYIKFNTEPKDKKMRERIKNSSNQYVVQQKILYHLWKYKTGHIQYSQICVPIEFQTLIMQSLHDLKVSGHASAKKCIIQLYADVGGQDYFLVLKIMLQVAKHV